MFLMTCRGFKDGRTAELMMQRAKKLKYNALKKKKLSRLGEKQVDFNSSEQAMSMTSRRVQLELNCALKLCVSDPKQRFEFYKRLEEVSKVKVTPNVRKNALPRKEYFQGRLTCGNTCTCWTIVAL